MEENIFDSTMWGRLTFFPARSDKWNDTCKHCLLARTPEECDRARCSAFDRADGRNGYFSIHEMPEAKSV